MKNINKADNYQKKTLKKILRHGTLDENPRPHYEDVVPNSAAGNWHVENDDVVVTYEKDGQTVTEKTHLEKNQTVDNKNGQAVIITPAYTLSINGNVEIYDLSKGEFPIQTLRPQAWKYAIIEILWIYQMQSNRLEDLHKFGIRYWDKWDIGDGTIGCRYGASIKRWNQINTLLEGLTNIKTRFGRRHIMNMYQFADFSDETGGTTKGLNPCCYETIWNVRRGSDGKLYLDMTMNQRSSDYIVSNFINEIQYAALLLMVARHCGYEPGVFTHYSENVQIYDRHIEQAKEIIARETVSGSETPKLVLKEGKTNFFDFIIDDFEVVGLDRTAVKEQNPQMEFDLGI